MEFLFPNYFIVAGSQKVTYIYSASGEKLATNANGSLTYYRSVMVYGNDNKLLYILTPEGTVTRNEGSSGTTYTYNYFKRDQIGNTPVMFRLDDLFSMNIFPVVVYDDSPKDRRFAGPVEPRPVDVKQDVGCRSFHFAHGLRGEICFKVRKVNM